MSGADTSKAVPVENSAWRIGFILVSVATAVFFFGEVVLLELARQAAMQSNQVYLNIHMINSYLPILWGTILIGVWTATLVVFASTHPKSATRNLEGIVMSMFGVYSVLAFIWFYRAILVAYWDYSTSPPVYPIYRALFWIPMNIYSNIFMILIIVFLSAFAWYRWLRPSSWE